LNSLNPSEFSFIQDYLSKFKKLKILAEDCNKEKKDGQLIYDMFAKLGIAYSVFVSTFHSIRKSIGVA